VATARAQPFDSRSKRALPDPDRVSFEPEAARICGVSHRTIERLVDRPAERDKQLPAPLGNFAARIWVPNRFEALSDGFCGQAADITRGGQCRQSGHRLFAENEGDDNARHHE